MEIKIGIQQSARELSIESDLDAAAVAQLVRDAGDVLELTDTKGRLLIVKVDKIAYVEVGTATAGAVGFRG